MKAHIPCWWRRVQRRARNKSVREMARDYRFRKKHFGFSKKELDESMARFTKLCAKLNSAVAEYLERALNDSCMWSDLAGDTGGYYSDEQDGSV